MRFSYNKLFKLLIDREINKKTLREMSGISATSVAKLGHGGNVNTEVLLKICDALNCDIGDIMEFVKVDVPEAEQKSPFPTQTPNSNRNWMAQQSERDRL